MQPTDLLTFILLIAAAYVAGSVNFSSWSFDSPVATTRVGTAAETPAPPMSTAGGHRVGRGGPAAGCGSGGRRGPGGQGGAALLAGDLGGVRADPGQPVSLLSRLQGGQGGGQLPRVHPGHRTGVGRPRCPGLGDGTPGLANAVSVILCHGGCSGRRDGIAGGGNLAGGAGAATALFIVACHHRNIRERWGSRE
jgi:hypothetical protein